jgi:hypothetical protein
MGRAWQFFLIIAIAVAMFGYLYYTSDYYAKRAADSHQPTVSAPATGAKAGAAE